MSRHRVEGFASACLVLSFGLVFFNLSAAQSFFGLAALGWLYLAITDRERQHWPGFVWPLAAYAILTVVSALAAAHRAGVLTSPSQLATFTSVVDLKQLVLFLMVPMVLRLTRSDRAMRALNVTIAIGAAAGLLGVIEYSLLGYDNLGNRPVGSLTHYMTYSGVILLVLSAAVARLLFYPQQIIWPAVAVPALVVALGATQTRGAWIGAAVAMATLFGLKRPRLVLVAPVVMAAALYVAPDSIQRRASSMFDTQDESNRDRIQMAAMGVAMVRDYPLVGVGPDNVGSVYGRYLRPNPVHTYNPHLHNVPIQIAAERGLPALAAWLAFVAVAAWELWQLLAPTATRALAAGGLGAMAAMLSAGLFEYNFGDSEFLMLFLALITLPFAAAARDRAGSR